MQHILHQSEVHILVHISFAQEIAGRTRSKEEVRLYVDVVSAEGLILHHCCVKVYVPLLVACRNECIEALPRLPDVQTVQFLEGESFQARPVSLVRIDDQPPLGVELGGVRGYETLLEASAEDDKVWVGLVGGDGEWEGLVEFLFVRHEGKSDDLIIIAV